MRHLKLFLAVLVAGCAIFAEGFPRPGVTGWLGSIRNAPAAVWAGSGTVAKGVTTSAYAATSGVANGAYGAVTYGAGAFSNGVTYGAGALSSGVTYGADALSSGVTYGAGAVSSGVTYGASAVSYGANAVTYGANAVVNGITYGAITATNGVLSSAKFFSGGAQAAANMVTEGVLNGASTVAGGVPDLARALSGVTTNYLTTSLGLPNLEDYVKFDMFEMLANLIVGQSAPNGGCGMNFETAAILLEKLASNIPALAPAVKGMKIVSFVLPQIRDSPKDKSAKDHAMTVMTIALDTYFDDIEPELKMKLKRAAPKIPGAVQGDMDSAREIIHVFIDRNTLKQVMFSAVRNMGFGTPLQYVLDAVTYVSAYSDGLNTITGVIDSVQKNKRPVAVPIQ